VGPKAPKQDLRYLKQFKIQGVNLSTVSYKSKGKSNEQGKRSRSMMNGKGAPQNVHHRMQNHRSKSIVKNPINTSTLQTKVITQESLLGKKVSGKSGSPSSLMKTAKSLKHPILTNVAQQSNVTERQSPKLKQNCSTLH